MPEQPWTHRYLFPLAEILTVAEDAASAAHHYALAPGASTGPALWWARTINIDVTSNAVHLPGQETAPVHCSSGTRGEDPWLVHRDGATALPLNRPSDLPGGTTLLAGLRQAARDGRTHFVIESGTTGGDPWFSYGVLTVPPAPAPAAPVWWALHEALTKAALPFTDRMEDGARWTEVELPDGTSIVISATVARDSGPLHPQDSFLSWSAEWVRHGPHDPSEHAQVYDSAGCGLGFTADTAALTGAVAAYVAAYRP